MDELREFEVPAEAAGARLDVFLARSMPEWSRSQIQRLIAAGQVAVGGRPARKAGETVEAGARIAVRAERAELRARPEDLPLDIVFEDDDLVALDKPAGMVVHMGAGVKAGTLVNALLHHIGKLSETGGPLRPGIVHRLDRMTSGLIVAAKNDAAHRALAGQFKSRQVRKTYTLLVHGRVEKESGEIRASVGRDPVRRVRMKAGGIRPREALTAFRVLRRFPHFTLVAAEPRTGRTHQLRVHFAHLRHPVVGDTLYGAPAKLRLGGREAPTLERNFLHAASLEFQHPRTGEALRLTAPLPAGLEAFLEKIEREDR
jgi:23S rRNA pseudouridine1911/1915/1917 synthase